MIESRTKFADGFDEANEENVEESFEEEGVRVAVLNLVDLAGSERVKDTSTIDL